MTLEMKKNQNKWRQNMRRRWFPQLQPGYFYVERFPWRSQLSFLCFPNYTGKYGA